MSDVLRIGLAGLGAIGRAHVERINNRLQGGRVVAGTDMSVDFGKTAAGELEVPFFESAEAMLAEGGIDALMVTAADPHHEAYVLAAIASCKPVFCEKPLAPTAAACQRIIAAEMATGRHLVQVGFMRRYDPGYRQLKSLVDSGRYGAPLMLHCAHRNFGVADSFDTPMAITSTLIHEIDILRWLIGEDYATVEMVLPKRTKNTLPHLHDPQIMILTSKSGVRMDVECFVNTRVGYDIQCEICCEEGFLKLPELPAVTILADVRRATPICRDWSDRFIEAYNIEIQDWIDATSVGEMRGPGSWDGLVACVTADAAQTARETGRSVPIELPDRPEFYGK